MKENNNSSNVDTPSSHTDTSDLSSLRSEIISYAQKFVGCPYVWGGTSLSNGADCSGFVYRIYSDFGYSIPRSSSEQAAGAGVQINISDRKPGDLVFYGDSNGNVNHVAMYIGDDMIVQAANHTQGIIISKYNYRNVIKMRRVVY
jgi:cell wall-associated NlpC family hydrolase